MHLDVQKHFDSLLSSFVASIGISSERVILGSITDAQCCLLATHVTLEVLANSSENAVQLKQSVEDADLASVSNSFGFPGV